MGRCCCGLRGEIGEAGVEVGEDRQRIAGQVREYRGGQGEEPCPGDERCHGAAQEGDDQQEEGPVVDQDVHRGYLLGGDARDHGVDSQAQAGDEQCAHQDPGPVGGHGPAGVRGVAAGGEGQADPGQQGEQGRGAPGKDGPLRGGFEGLGVPGRQDVDGDHPDQCHTAGGVDPGQASLGRCGRGARCGIDRVVGQSLMGGVAPTALLSGSWARCPASGGGKMRSSQAEPPGDLRVGPLPTGAGPKTRLTFQPSGRH